ncbi:hypothetical protein Bp8pS_120 [Bacillus phage vB_BpuM-BpSp]|nr:hypothetical protein Bp8pS_120 [Bacillus phage vB_BpuM-BpSp]
MEYSLKDLINNGLEVTWETVYVGSERGILKYNDLEDFATDYLNKNKNCDNQLILNLSWGDFNRENLDGELYNVLKSLDCKVIMEHSDQWNKELRKWRYSKLVYLNSKYKEDFDLLLDSIYKVYADFDYHPDMLDFIHYMNNPVKELSKEENQKNLVMTFREFLDKEKLELQNK